MSEVPLYLVAADDAARPCAAVHVHAADQLEIESAEEGRCKATWKREFKLPWREAGPPNHHDDKVDSDQ